MLILKNAVFFRTVLLLVLVCFTGCVTTKIEYVDSEKLPKKKVYHITEVYMKDGKIIDLKGKDPVFKSYDKGVKNVIVYYEDVNIERTILLENVSKLKIEVSESNVTVNVIIIVSSIILFFLALILIYKDSINLSPH